MPFDFTKQQEPEAVRVLKAAKALISDPKRWCRFVLRDRSRFCAEGAVFKVCGYEMRDGCKFTDQSVSEASHEPAALFLVRAARMNGALYPFIINDTRKHEDVMRMFDLAIELAWQDALAEAR